MINNEIKNVYGDIEIIKNFEPSFLAALFTSDRYEKILLNTLIFLILISCDLYLGDFLPSKLTSNFLPKPSGVDFISILSQ